MFCGRALSVHSHIHEEAFQPDKEKRREEHCLTGRIDGGGHGGMAVPEMTSASGNGSRAKGKRACLRGCRKVLPLRRTTEANRNRLPLHRAVSWPGGPERTTCRKLRRGRRRSWQCHGRRRQRWPPTIRRASNTPLRRFLRQSGVCLSDAVGTDCFEGRPGNFKVLVACTRADTNCASEAATKADWQPSGQGRHATLGGQARGGTEFE